MAFYVVAVGRMKDSSVRDACMDYAARIGRHLKLEIVEVKDSGRPDKQAAAAREDEGRSLLKAIPRGALIVALTRAGHGEPSSSFAKRIGAWRDQSADVAFVVGGAHGLAEKILSRADVKLSVSQMTLPHELARLMLLEQLYRACTILRGEPYHKGG
jgi:23S rRNA (pseudouridine1915-N3)-methyltransferase